MIFERRESEVFERRESEVRSYCRTFPTVFRKAEGAELFGEDGKRYIDFFAGAGALNYGHNNPRIREKIISYLNSCGIVHSLDMFTPAKREFLQAMETLILKPFAMDYKIQFPGPTGTNAVEAAIKLARKVTGRSGIIAFTNGYHGMTAGALAVTGNNYHRRTMGGMLGNTTFMPYDGYFGPDVDTADYLEKFILDESSGVDPPAAVLLETVQGEGGINVASFHWLRRVEEICHRNNILVIVDDIQAGCGRTGSFFSFTPAGMTPDIITLSKSLGAYGLPFSVVLLRPHLDCWDPGEHNGTFRGNNLAFVAATEALRLYWTDTAFSQTVRHKAQILRHELDNIIGTMPPDMALVRGRGLMCGMVFEHDAKLAKLITAEAFQRGLILETCGARDQVVKFLPPLIIDESLLLEGIAILRESVASVLAACRNHKNEIDNTLAQEVST